MNETAYRALREEAAWIDLTGRGQIRATGEDRARFLHAMTTNHVQGLLPGTGCYAFLLSAQGRILSDLNIYCMTDYLLLDTEPESRQVVLQHLDKFIIADDVALEDFSEATAVVAVEGPAAEAALSGVGAPHAHMDHSIVEWEHCLVARRSYTGGLGYWIFLPFEEKDHLLEKLVLPQADLPTADTVRLEHGSPRYGVDFTNANIAQETQQMHAVHFSKGCYVGQEIVERVRSRGHANKLLVPLNIEGDAPSSGTKVLSQGKEVGEITSAAFSPALGVSVALALLRSEAINASLSANGAIARVRPAGS